MKIKSLVIQFTLHTTLDNQAICTYLGPFLVTLILETTQKVLEASPRGKVS